jgi:hypothetical protein
MIDDVAYATVGAPAEASSMRCASSDAIFAAAPSITVLDT